MKSFFHKKSVLIIAIGLLVIIILTTTYADYAFPRIQTIVSKILEIDEEAYGKNVFDSSSLDLRPILDTKVENNDDQVIHISFLVGGSSKNNVEDIVYDIALVDLKVDCFLLSPYLKWKLVKNNKVISDGSFDYQFDTIKNGRLVLTNIQQDLPVYSEDKSSYDQYDFYLWLSDSCQEESLEQCKEAYDQSSLLGRTIKGKIEVELYAKTKKVLVRNPSSSIDVNTCMIKDGDQDAFVD